jgi:hypothetical protein
MYIDSRIRTMLSVHNLNVTFYDLLAFSVEILDSVFRGVELVIIRKTVKFILVLLCVQFNVDATLLHGNSGDQDIK